MKALKTSLLVVLILFTMMMTVVCATEHEAARQPVVIDVRTEAEWSAGHLEGAVLIPYERIGAEIQSVVTDKKEKIFLYCRTGRRTGIAYETLKKAGYENLINLETVENAANVLGRKITK